LRGILNNCPFNLDALCRRVDLFNKVGANSWDLKQPF
jgi:hypothetical protein